VDLPIENGGSFHSFLLVYQREIIYENKQGIKPWDSPCKNPLGFTMFDGKIHDDSTGPSMAMFKFANA
jgi:hypothetical protein